MPVHKRLLIVISILAAITFSCQFLSVQPTSTPIPRHTKTLAPTQTNTLLPPTATETPEPTLTPTNTPRPGLGVDSLCLNVEITNYEKNPHGDIRKVLMNVFGNYGMGLLQGGTCDATLSIAVTYEVRSAEYKDSDTGKSRTCYTGTSAVGEMIFEKPGSDPKVYKINKKISPPSGTIYACPTENRALLSSAWSDDVIDGLYTIFGPEVLAHVLFHGTDPGGFPNPEHAAKQKLKELGPKAKESVPIILNYLTTRYGDELPDFDPTVSSALTALKAISGEDFGNDLNAWNDWWKNQQ